MGKKKRNVAAEPSGEFAKRQPSSDRSNAGIALALGSASALASDGQMGTLSEADKVAETAVVPVRSKFADLSVEQRLEEAKLMSFEERDAYLRGRCKVARIEFAAAMSALDRATGLIEDNLPFFIVHFEDLDKRGHRSDLKGKPISKTEWLKQNVPNISKGTFYDALNAVKARYADQERLMLGGEALHRPQHLEGTAPEAKALQPRPRPKLRLTQHDINRLIDVGHEAARMAEVGLKQNKSEDDYRALHDSYRKIAKLAEPRKLDSLRAESAKEAEANIQRGKAINAAKRLAELTLGWCKECASQVRSDSKLLGIAQSAQGVMNLINGTHDQFALPEIPQACQARGQALRWRHPRPTPAKGGDGPRLRR